jgi:predicted RNase H-like HicB family nuclease
MQYPIFIHKDKKSDYGVIVPDLPGCYSAGTTVEEAISNAHEAIECHLEGLLKDGEPIPAIKPLDKHLNAPELSDGILALIDIDVTKISGKSKRIDITLPERFLKQIDDYIKNYGANNRSAFLAEAAMKYMSEHKLNNGTHGC